MTDRSGWIRVYLSPRISRLEKEYAFDQFVAIVRQGDCASFRAKDYGPFSKKGGQISTSDDTGVVFEVYGHDYIYNHAAHAWTLVSAQLKIPPKKQVWNRAVPEFSAADYEPNLQEKLKILSERPNRFLSIHKSSTELLKDALDLFRD